MTSPPARRVPRSRSAPATRADGDLDAFPVAADGELKDETDLAFDKPVTAHYVLVWVTGLVPSENGFSADIAEVAVNAAG